MAGIFAACCFSSLVSWEEFGFYARIFVNGCMAQVVGVRFDPFYSSFQEGVFPRKL